MMKNWRISWRMRAESRKFRCHPHCLARLNVRSTGRPVALKRSARQNTLALLRRRIYEEAHGRISSQVSWRSYCRKRHDFIKSLQFSAQIYSCASSNKNTRCSSGKIMGKTLENTSMAAAESQKPKGGDRWSKEWGQNRTCCVVNGRTSSQEFGVGTQNSEIQRSSCAPKWHCERWFRIGITIYWAKIISITNDGCKSHGCQSKATRMRTTSSRRSIRLHPGQNGRCTDVTKKFQESECPDIWIRVAKHKWPKSWSSMEDPVVPLERNLYGHPLARLLWEKEFEKVLLEHGWEKVPTWECLFGKREKRTTLVCVCVRYKTGWKETKHWPNVESTSERSRFWRNNILP